MMDEADALALVRQTCLDPQQLVRAIGSGRRRGQQPSMDRVELRPVAITSGDRLQITCYINNQASATNLAWGSDAAQHLDRLLGEPFANWHVDARDEQLQIRVTRSGRANVHRSAATREPSTNHDRVKPRHVDRAAPFLRALGITNQAGEVRAKRADKLHQVEAFSRAVGPALEQSTADPVYVVDLGCGNAYLTFATFHALTQLGRHPAMVGIDIKQQSREHNVAVAAELGWDQQIAFIEGAIATVEIETLLPRVDVAMALHACDTATDDALVRAVRWKAQNIFAAPCCHHDLQRRVAASASAPSAVASILRHGVLKERQVDLLTDAWRALVLRLLGYRVEVVEFVGSKHTPRNVMIRARRTGTNPQADLWQQHDELREAWGCQPYLVEALAADLLEARAKTSG